MKIMGKIQSLILALILCFAILPTQKTTALADEKLALMSNCVALVRLKDSQEFVSSEFLSTLDQMYNTSSISLKNYFLKQSLGTLAVDTSIITGAVSIELDHTVEYYTPKYSYNNSSGRYEVINSLGYDNRYFIKGQPVAPTASGALEHIERVQREQAMLREIATKLKGSLKRISADGNNDQNIDAFTIIVDNSSYAQQAQWDNILWPHMSYVYEFSKNKLDPNYYLPDGFFEEKMTDLENKASIDGLYINSYNLLTTGYITDEKLSGDYVGLGNVGVLCHEFMHNLGLYDYYSYSDSSYQSVGELEILGQTQAIPQMNLSYIRQKKGWLSEGENILPIEKSGHYTLDAVTTDNPVKAYKLVLNDYLQTNEYFMMEMRSNVTGGFDSMLASSGLVIYRVNENNGYIGPQGEYGIIPYGNMYGDKGNEEVYVYRAGCYDRTTVDNKSLAILDGGEIQNGYYYDMSMIGTKDKTAQKSYFLKQSGGLLPFMKRTYYNTTIHYGNGQNSGVAITNIKLSQDKTSVSFDIEFDDTATAVCDSDYAKISSAVGGKIQVDWSSGARNGKAYVLVTEYDDKLLKFSNGEAYAKKLPTADEMISGQMSGYSTINHLIKPISFKQTKLEQSLDGYAVFVMLDDGETQVIKFAGAIKGQSSNGFGKFLSSGIIQVLIFGSCGIIVIIAIVSVVAVRKKKR